MSPSRSMLIGSPMAYTERIPPYGWELPQDLILRAIICSIFSTVCENEGRILKLSFIMYKFMQDFEIKSVHFVSEITKQMILQETQQDHTWLVGIQATICIKKPWTYCLPSCTVKQRQNCIEKASRKTLSAWTTELKKKINAIDTSLINITFSPKTLLFFWWSRFWHTKAQTLKKGTTW